MRKEIILAVILGLGLGLFITYGVYTARNSLTQPKLIPSPTPVSDTTTQTLGTLVVHSPEDEHIQTETETLLSGTTVPKSMVVALVNDLEKVTTADEVGAFSFSLTLQTGANLITLHAFDPNGQESRLERTIIVADQSLELAAPASASASPSPSVKPKTSPSSSPKASVTP